MYQSETVTYISSADNILYYTQILVIVKAIETAHIPGRFAS